MYMYIYIYKFRCAKIAAVHHLVLPHKHTSMANSLLCHLDPSQQLGLTISSLNDEHTLSILRISSRFNQWMVMVQRDQNLYSEQHEGPR